MRENPNTGFCAHSHYVRIRNTTSAFIPCNDHNFISPVAVQLKPILRFVLLSQILSVPFCILIWYGFCFSKMNCISSYRAVGLWGISPWKSCKTAFRFGWKFHNFRYIWKAKKKKKRAHCIPCHSSSSNFPFPGAHPGGGRVSREKGTCLIQRVEALYCIF